MERWLPIVGYEGLYEVSDKGRVRSVDRIVMAGNRWQEGSFPRRYQGRILKQTKNFQRCGHMHVILSRVGVQTNYKVHVLMLEAFVEPRPPGLEALHTNDIGDDNRIDNLSWGTRSMNMHDAVRNGRNHNANKTKCPAGHEYSEVNTRIQPYNGSRRCRTCDRERKG
jgi:hypothetical protein